MARTRIDKIELACKNQVREFDLKHAERLLNMENNGGWEIPEDSKFKLHKRQLVLKDNK